MKKLYSAFFYLICYVLLTILPVTGYPICIKLMHMKRRFFED